MSLPDRHGPSQAEFHPGAEVKMNPSSPRRSRCRVALRVGPIRLDNRDHRRFSAGRTSGSGEDR